MEVCEKCLTLVVLGLGKPTLLILKQAKLPTQHFQATLMFFDALLCRKLENAYICLKYNAHEMNISKKMMQAQAYT